MGSFEPVLKYGASFQDSSPLDLHFDVLKTCHSGDVLRHLFE